MNYRMRIPKSMRDEMMSWGLPARPHMVDLLNTLHIDIPANPGKFLVEPIVPFIDRFACPIMVPAFPPYTSPLQIMFFLRRTDDEIQVIATRFPAIESGNGDTV